ncbi:MAG: hypothetical protein U5R14_03075 [Gemmatimonadota bacterium]|nr:hypothetical protein [Gemmatimonadota bacterium]
MDTRNTRARLLGFALFAAAVAVGGLPDRAEAQAAQQTADAPSVSEERLTTYATLHRAIQEAQEEFQAEKASVHETDARERLREEMDERLAALYEEHEMTKEEYDGITFLLSVDNEARSRFEEIVASLDGTDDSDDHQR